MRTQQLKSTLVAAFASLCFAWDVSAEVSFVSASNSNASLFTTIADDGGSTVFVFKGLADGEASTFTFATNDACPFVAVTGGAKFNAAWSCLSGVITTDVTYQGGLSFGPATDDNAGSFYITFNNPPTPEGLDAPPSELAGIQFSLYGDISKWGVVGGQTSSGISFGIELTGSQGGEEHLTMQLPAAAAAYLGSVLGMTVAGKPNPFANVTTNEDGSVTLSIDIADLQKSTLQSRRPGVNATSIKKKFLAGARSLGGAFAKSSVSAGKSVSFAACAGSTFTAGDTMSVKYTVGGKADSALKNTKLTLNAKGCATKAVRIAKSLKGKKVVAKVAYKGAHSNASLNVK